VACHTKILVRPWQIRKKSEDTAECILLMVIAPQFKMIIPNSEGHDKEQLITAVVRSNLSYLLAKKFKTYQKLLQRCKLTFKKPFFP
jgi:hypothetical protein